MKKAPRLGFTLIEVVLFLGLSGFLMIGLIAGASVSIARQRYNDSVNSFAEYLRSAYSEVINVSNDKPHTHSGEADADAGRTNYAVYGKLIVIEPKLSSDISTNYINSYDVIGLAVSSASIYGSTTLEVLKNISANIVETKKSASGGLTTYEVYRQNSFTIPWDASLQEPNSLGSDSENGLFKGAIMIIRSPLSGNIQTFYISDDSLLTGILSDNFANLATNPSDSTINDTFKRLVENKSFSETQVDICIDSPDNNLSNRRNVRIQQYASNSSGVFLEELDGENSKCHGNS